MATTSTPRRQIKKGETPKTVALPGALPRMTNHVALFGCNVCGAVSIVRLMLWPLPAFNCPESRAPNRRPRVSLGLPLGFAVSLGSQPKTKTGRWGGFPYQNHRFCYNGHFLNLAPRFRVMEPLDQPGLNLRLVMHLNEPQNFHYLPVVTPQMILQETVNDDFQVLGPFARSCAPPLPLQGAGEAPIGSL